MTSLNDWITHFRNMAQNKLPPNSLQVVRSGGGVKKIYYRVTPQVENPNSKQKTKKKPKHW